MDLMPLAVASSVSSNAPMLSYSQAQLKVVQQKKAGWSNKIRQVQQKKQKMMADHHRKAEIVKRESEALKVTRPAVCDNRVRQSPRPLLNRVCAVVDPLASGGSVRCRFCRESPTSSSSEKVSSNRWILGPGTQMSG